MCREIDKLIAEKVFGFKNIFDAGERYNLSFKKISYRGDEPGKNPERDIPSYSTNISAAWEVVEKMSERQGHIETSISKYRDVIDEDHKYSCMIWTEKTLIEGEYASTPAMAICTTTLKVIKDEEDL